MNTISKLERINQANNMVDITAIIGQDVFYSYCQKFGQEHRKFNRSKESQESWTNSMMATYHNEMMNERILLFNAIPSKFFKTIMYAKLKQNLIK